MLADRAICRRHDQFFQLFEVNPSEIMAPKGFENAFLNPAMVSQEKDGVLWIGMVDGLKNHSHLHLDIQFLFQLSSQGLSWLFPLFHLPPWKFPEKALVRILFSLGDEDSPLSNDHPCGDDDGLHLIPLLGYGLPS